MNCVELAGSPAAWPQGWILIGGVFGTFILGIMTGAIIQFGFTVMISLMDKRQKS